MKRLKIAFVLLIIILLSLMAFLIYENADMIVKSDASRKFISPGAEFSLKSPRFVEMRGGEKVLEVTAEESLYYKGDSLAELKKPVAIFYGDGGRKTSISGDRGIIDTDTNDIEVEGNVVVETPDGYAVKTSSVKYLAGEMIITTDKSVRIWGDGFDIKGIGMKANLEKETFQIPGSVEAVFDISSSGRYLGRVHENK